MKGELSAFHFVWGLALIAKADLALVCAYVFRQYMCAVAVASCVYHLPLTTSPIDLCPIASYF